MRAGSFGSRSQRVPNMLSDTPRSGKDGMPLSHLEHFLVQTKDIEQTRDWYCDVLGMVAGPTPDFKFPVVWLYIGDRDVVHVTEGGKGRFPEPGDLSRPAVRRRLRHRGGRPYRVPGDRAPQDDVPPVGTSGSNSRSARFRPRACTSSSCSTPTASRSSSTSTPRRPRGSCRRSWPRISTRPSASSSYRRSRVSKGRTDLTRTRRTKSGEACNDLGIR